MKKSLAGVSLLTMCSLYFVLSVVIILITLIIDLPIKAALLLSIIIIIVQFLISPLITDLTMKLFYSAKYNPEIPDYLKKFIEEVCISNNMKYPKIGYIDDGAPNAFTYGHTKNDARIVLTRGIFELLTEDEVKAVVGHELGHAAHYDMLVMTAAQLVPLILYYIFETFTSVENDSDEGNKAQMIGWIAFILYSISHFIILGLSRSREYYADSFSIEATKNPNALANALVKIGFGLSTTDTGKKHSPSRSNALGIFDSKASKALVVSSTTGNGEIDKKNIKEAMKWEKWNIWAKWYEISSTHPLISKRLEAITNRSEEFGQEPYIVFDLEKKESYLDDFLTEIFISFLPATVGLIAIGISFAVALLNPKYFVLELGIAQLAFIIALYINFKRKYRSGKFRSTTVRDLLGEVKVSHITSIACSLEGNIIGRGNPGCIFDEDFVVKDNTGIMFLDYNQPINILNKIFAIFKSEEYFDKKVKINGWYRRNPVPYIELNTIEIDGKIKKIHTYTFSKVMYVIFTILSILLILFGIVLAISL